MRKEERQANLAPGGVAPETPRDRRQPAALDEDNLWNPLAGRPLRLSLRNFRPAEAGYLASVGGPLPYMVRLREIDVQTTAHVTRLQAAWLGLVEEETDVAQFARRWTETVGRWPLDEVNDLIDRHNRWYPVESRLPMDPQTGDHALVNGEHYRRAPLDALWVLQRFPPDRNSACARAPV